MNNTSKFERYINKKLERSYSKSFNTNCIKSEDEYLDHCSDVFCFMVCFSSLFGIGIATVFIPAAFGCIVYVKDLFLWFIASIVFALIFLLAFKVSKKYGLTTYVTYHNMSKATDNSRRQQYMNAAVCNYQQVCKNLPNNSYLKEKAKSEIFRYLPGTQTKISRTLDTVSDNKRRLDLQHSIDNYQRKCLNLPDNTYQKEYAWAEIFKYL